MYQEKEPPLSVGSQSGKVIGNVSASQHAIKQKLKK
jgi:hypothetical protein